MRVEDTAVRSAGDARASARVSVRPHLHMPDSDSPEESAPPPLLIVNARVSTGDLRRPWADAALVRAGRIEAVGASAELRKRAPAGVIAIDARGMRLLPESAGSVVAPGQRADLVLVDQTADAVSADAPEEVDIVLRIVEGRVVLDRGASA